MSGPRSTTSTVETANRVCGGTFAVPSRTLSSFAVKMATSAIARSYPFGVRLSGLNPPIRRRFASIAFRMSRSERTATGRGTNRRN